MAKKDDRPIDVGLAALIGKDEQSVIGFWKKRFELIAAIPSDIARVGAVTPQLRELSRVEPAERRRLTKARIVAFGQLAPETQQLITVARKAAFDVDRAVLESDEQIVQQVRAEVPGSTYPSAQ